MSQETILLYVMATFVLVSAVALCVQAGLLFGIYKSSKALQDQVTPLLPQVKGLLSKAELTIEQSRKNIVEITAKANEISSKANDISGKALEMMDLGKSQLVKLDLVMTDASSRAKVQIERAELVVDDTVSRVHESVTAVHNGILRPIREINGVAAGVKTAVSTFLKGGRPSVDKATQDDEMFI